MQKQAVIKGPPPTTEEVARVREWAKKVAQKKAASDKPAKARPSSRRSRKQDSGARHGSES